MKLSPYIFFNSNAKEARLGMLTDKFINRRMFNCSFPGVDQKENTTDKILDITV
ncbi:hypothetical protein BH09BAC2_BH09BAC2_21950 [soil metagenome]